MRYDVAFPLALKDMWNWALWKLSSKLSKWNGKLLYVAGIFKVCRIFSSSYTIESYSCWLRWAGKESNSITEFWDGS